MGRSNMKIGVLTSSRADYGIYLPLLKSLANDPYFEVDIIAFGTHLSENHGFTLNEIKSNNYGNIIRLKTTVADDDPYAIAIAYSNVSRVFADFWNDHSYDLVLCLGDRYEMNAAVQASIPFNVTLAHFHGGEKTLGAFDNIYRHQISTASKYHFTAAEELSDRVKELLDENTDFVYSVGSMSLSDLEENPIISLDEIIERYAIPRKPFILCTFHPETIKMENNSEYAEEMIESFRSIPNSHHLVVSMPNADTYGKIFRGKLEEYKSENPNAITLVESFGKTNYLSAMKHCSFLLGNSSSGIIEAASFNKHVINVGTRQEGRMQSGNVTNVPFDRKKIGRAILDLIENPKTFSGQNKYVKKDTISNVTEILKSIGHGKS